MHYAPWMRLEVVLRCGTVLDCKDCSGIWLEGVVRDIRDDNVRIHYQGWNDRFDEWIDLRKRGRLAPKGSHTKAQRSSPK